MLIGMKITRKTKMADITAILNEDRVRQLSQQVPAKPLEKPLLKMSCGEFIAAMDEEFAMSFFKREKYAFDAFGKYRQYLDEMQGVTAYLKRYEVEQEADEKAAAQGVDFPSLGERILLDCVRHYNLHSTAEAERMPIVDWLLVVKSDGAAAQYQRRLSKIQQRKNNNSHGRK